MTVNFVNDLPRIRAYIADCVQTQAKVGEPISAIEIGFRLDQICLVALNFDVREKHLRDGTWDVALDGQALELPHWNEAYEAADSDGISFILLTGEPYKLPTGAKEEEIVGVFGEALVAIALDANTAGVFQYLPLKRDCQLDLEEFDGRWGWPSEAFDPDEVDRANELGCLPATRLQA